MKKFVALLLILTVFVTLLCACSNNKSDTQSNASSDDKSTSNASLTESSAVDESDIFSFVIKLDGEKYTLPCNKSEFEDNGWELSPQSIDHTPEKTMKPDSSASYKLKKYDKDTGKAIHWDGAYSIFANNFTQSDAKLKDLPIYGFLFTGYKLSGDDNNPELELPGGLVFKHATTKEDIISVYGEPQEIESYKPVFKSYNATDLDYKKREGDFVKMVSFKVVDQSEDSSNEPINVRFEYIYDPEHKVEIN